MSSYSLFYVVFDESSATTRGAIPDMAEKSLTGTFVLVQLIRDRVRIPVIAAGGIATGRGIAAALALGAVHALIGETSAYLHDAEQTAAGVR
jgi:nitronate monooxygenase